MKEVDGLVNTKNAKPPNPKPSPKDFVWPSQRDHDDAVARKIAASLQELLPQKSMRHADLARTLWGVNKVGQARNVSAARAWVTGEHPIPNEVHAGYLAQVLDVPMARLLEPEGKFDPHPEMIRTRSPNGVNLAKMGKKKTKNASKAGFTASGRDREKQRAYNAKYRAAKKAGKTPGELSWYMRNKLKKKGKRKAAQTNGSGPPPEGNGTWVLADGVPVPEYQLAAHAEFPGHVKLTIEAVVPQPRAIAILHMLEHQSPPEEE